MLFIADHDVAEIRKGVSDCADATHWSFNDRGWDFPSSTPCETEKWDGIATIVNLSLSASDYLTYSVVLYINGDGQNGSVGRYWLESWTDPLTAGTVITDQVGIISNGYSGTFVSAGSYSQTGTPANVDAAFGNYIVLENITAQNVRVRSAGNGDPEDFGRGPLNAIQVVNVPEPTATFLLGFGCFGLLRRRRQAST